MPILYLLRHAKAEKAVKHAWDPADDKNRPLTALGMADAAAVGRWFRARGSIPGVALVSPAHRTLQTWQIAAREMGASLPLRIEGALYEAKVVDLLRLIRDLPPEFTSAIVVGHDPSLSDLLGVDLPTCALARLELGQWTELSPKPAGLKVRRIRAEDEGD
jgi:phosphohistidine phosphatase